MVRRGLDPAATTTAVVDSLWVRAFRVQCFRNSPCGKQLPTPPREGMLGASMASKLLPPTAACLLPLLASACVGSRKAIEPTLQLRSEHGMELGVSTDYGIVFLGNATDAGPLEITAWFGDGPSIETTAVEPIGHGLYTAETEIVLPSVAIAFSVPETGSLVEVRGRRGWDVWSQMLPIAEHPQVDGLLLAFPGDLPEEGPRIDQVGAGVYVQGANKTLRLLGLVSGVLVLETDQGQSRFLTVVGPDQLWRLVAHHRAEPLQKRWVYREDIL